MKENERKSILIVDDDIDLLEGMQLIFEDEGWTVFTHNGQSDIMSFVRQHDVDVVVLDVFLPRDNGNDIALQVRQETRSQKIILISAAGQLNRLSATADVDAYLQKPFRLENLVELAEKVLHSDSGNQDGGAKNGGSFTLFESGQPLAYSRSHVRTE